MGRNQRDDAHCHEGRIHRHPVHEEQRSETWICEILRETESSVIKESTIPRTTQSNWLGTN